MKYGNTIIFGAVCVILLLLVQSVEQRLEGILGISTTDVPYYTTMYDQFVLFGDSLLQHSSSQERGFALAPALQAAYIRRLDVINRGFSGYNTTQALRILPRIIGQPSLERIRFLVVFFGANDSCLKGAAGGQHVPLEQFKTNIASIVTHPSIQQHRPRILLLSPPPIDEYGCEENDRLKGYKEPRREAEHTKLYADATRQVAYAHNIAFVDVWKIFMRQAGHTEGSPLLPGSKALPPNTHLRLMLHDGIHFTHFAYATVFQELLRVIQITWPDQSPQEVPFVLPAWNDPDAWERMDNERAQ